MTLRTGNVGQEREQGGSVMRMVVWIALVFLLACGGSEEPTSDSGTSTTSETASPKGEIPKARLERQWTWPADKAPAGGIVADWDACTEPFKDWSADLRNLKLAAECMNEKGWEAAPAP